MCVYVCVCVIAILSLSPSCRCKPIRAGNTIAKHLFQFLYTNVESLAKNYSIFTSRQRRWGGNVFSCVCLKEVPVSEQVRTCACVSHGNPSPPKALLRPPALTIQGRSLGPSPLHVETC